MYQVPEALMSGQLGNIRLENGLSSDSTGLELGKIQTCWSRSVTPFHQ